jgi:drug/metabolite transporter (DMT)-like permease
MTVPSWLWIPITLWAAFAQSFRNAAQRRLTVELGVIGATSVRFFYGLPFAAVWFVVVLHCTSSEVPQPNASFSIWLVVAAVAQVAGTALLIRVMKERNFALGVAYSKTEAVQVAVIAVGLGDRLSPLSAAAVVVATIGVVLISSGHDAYPLRALLRGWTVRSAWLGLTTGAMFALAAVGFRGATVALKGANYLVAAGMTLVVAQSLQSFLLAGWFQLRERGAIGRIVRLWRGSMWAGFMGAAASAGWFTAMAIEPVAHVRTLGMSELLFSLVISRRIFGEHLRTVEQIGMCLLGCGLIVIALAD